MDWQMSVFYFIFFTLDITSNISSKTDEQLKMSPYFHTSHPNIAIYSQDMRYM